MRFRLLFFLLLVFSAWGLSSCKDGTKTHEAANLEACKVAIDNQEWDAAVSSCAEVQTDEGYHLTAQAYLARGGVALFDVLSAMTGDNSSFSTLFNALPTTAAQVADIKLGLTALAKIEAPDSFVYTEGLLASAMVILQALKAELSLDVAADGTVSHCASGGSIDGCSFGLTLSDTEYTASDVVAGAVPVTATFSGLSNDLYNSLCDTQDSTSDSAKVVSGRDSSDTYDVNVTEDFTVNGCTVATTSVLWFNQWASTGLATTGSTLTALDQLKFYSSIDTGNNFSKEVSASLLNPITISICNSDAIPTTASGDLLVNDCEMLSFFTNLSLN
ncbi:MAG: hypothetical protein RRB13_03505 [bacterium]|nr:hypothetical protein [bacterium]